MEHRVSVYTDVIPIVLHSAGRNASYGLKKSRQRRTGCKGLKQDLISLTGPVIKLMTKITFKPTVITVFIAALSTASG
jgi:hypothetical protein